MHIPWGILSVTCHNYAHVFVIQFCSTGNYKKMRPCDVPRSWRFLAYVSVLSGCSNVYRCHWLPRWLRCLSVIYQMTVLSIYVTIFGIALADSGFNPSLTRALNKEAILSIFVMIIVSHIVILWQTFRDSGLFALFHTRRTLQITDSHAAKYTIWHSAINITIALITTSLGLILIGVTVFHAIEKKPYVVTKLFPFLESHDTQDVIFGV